MRVCLSRRPRLLTHRAAVSMSDSATPAAPPPPGAAQPSDACVEGDTTLRIVCTPEEERIFATLLAAVRHHGACAWLSRDARL